MRRGTGVNVGAGLGRSARPARGDLTEWPEPSTSPGPQCWCSDTITSRTASVLLRSLSGIYKNGNLAQSTRPKSEIFSTGLGRKHRSPSLRYSRTGIEVATASEPTGAVLLGGISPAHLRRRRHWAPNQTQLQSQGPWRVRWTCACKAGSAGGFTVTEVCSLSPAENRTLR